MPTGVDSVQRPVKPPIPVLSATLPQLGFCPVRARLQTAMKE